MTTSQPTDILPIAVVLSAILGLVVGSFLNVVVYRVPAGLSIVSPPSACPRCGAAIRRRDNVPVLSWVILRGKCRDCDTRISVRYPLVEAGTALFFVAIAVRVSAGSVALVATDIGISTVAPVWIPAFLVFLALLYLGE
ncbi:prepilin peptidase [Cryobacterium breve]|uniref:prepilin peptidase n=1 Tax=Cryobacterium breve TaxID=1259258 RepID=UPI0032B268D3